MKKDRQNQRTIIVENILKNFDYGDLITYGRIERMIGYKRDDIQFSYVFNGIKNELINYGCVLKSIIGEGYRILFPNEVAQEVYNTCAMQGLGRFAKGIKIMASVDKSMLSEKELAQHEEFENMLRMINKNNEDSLLKAQVLLNISKAKELDN